MRKLTYHERRMKSYGYTIIEFTHDEIVDHLLEVFKRDEGHLLSLVLEDNTNRRELAVILDFENIGDQRTTFGGMAYYSRKKRKFTHIIYSDRHNCSVIFSIETKVAHFSYEFWKPLLKIQRFWSIKKLKLYLLNN